MRKLTPKTKIFFIATFVAIIIGLSTFISATITNVNAQGGAICIPAECQQDYIPDTNCITRKLLQPGTDCCENKCPGTTGTNSSTQEVRKLARVFGQDIYVYSDKILAGAVNMAMTTVLGFISAYSLIYGIYVGAYVRSQTTDSAEIANANRTMVNLIIGFILAWSLIFIIQIVFSVLGLGSINEIVITGEETKGLTINDSKIKGSQEFEPN